jgi:hypothetical protein
LAFPTPPPAVKNNWHVLVAAIFGIPLAVMCAIATLHGDILWHEVFGPIILAHGVIHRPVLTYTAHHNFIEPEWLYDIVLHYFVVGLGALSGARIFTAATVFTAYVAICVYAVRAQIRSELPSATRFVATVVLASITLTTFIGMHPQEMGYLLWVAALLVSIRARSNPRLFLWLIPIAAVWVNVDGTFLLLFVLLLAELGLAVLDTWLPKIKPILPQALPLKYIGIAIVGAVIVVMLSPYGGVALIESQIKSSFWQPMKTIAIWSPFASSSVSMIVAILGAAAACVWVVTKRQGGLAAVAGLAGIVMGMTSTILLPYGLLAAAIAISSVESKNAVEEKRAHRWKVMLVAPVMIGALALAWGPARPIQSLAPTAARTHLPAPTNRIFTTYYWGDWLVSLHRPAFVYGETFQWVDTPLITQYEHIMTLQVNPTPIFKKYDIHYALLPTDSALARYLANADKWHVVWRDSGTCLLKQ